MPKHTAVGARESLNLERWPRRVAYPDPASMQSASSEVGAGRALSSPISRHKHAALAPPYTRCNGPQTLRGRVCAEYYPTECEFCGLEVYVGGFILK